MTDTMSDGVDAAETKPRLFKCECVFCGGEFNWYFNRNFCSQKCSTKFKTINKKIKITEQRVCLFCTKKADIPKNGKFCSQTCRRYYNLNKDLINDNEIDYTNKIFRDTGIKINIKNREDFFIWLQNNFFLFGLKSLHGDYNKLACENFSGKTFTLDLRYFGNDEFNGLCFIRSLNSKAKSLFILDHNIYVSDFLNKIIKNQTDLLV